MGWEMLSSYLAGGSSVVVQGNLQGMARAKSSLQIFTQKGAKEPS